MFRYIRSLVNAEVTDSDSTSGSDCSDDEDIISAIPRVAIATGEPPTAPTKSAGRDNNTTRPISAQITALEDRMSSAHAAQPAGAVVSCPPSGAQLPCQTCAHRNSDLVTALDTLYIDLDLPDVLSKSGLKRANRDLDDIARHMARLARDTQADSVRLAALAIICNRLCRDEKILKRLISEYEFLSLVAHFLRAQCLLCKAAGLHLAVTVVQTSVRDVWTISKIGRTVLPAVVDAVKDRRTGDALTELCGMFLVNYIMGLLCVEDEPHRRDLLAGLSHCSTLVGRCTTGLFSGLVLLWAMTAIEGPMFFEPLGRPFFDFLVGVLRVGGPLNRLQAMRGLYLHRRPDRPGLSFLDITNRAPFDLDRLTQNAKSRLNLMTDNCDTPDVQQVVFSHTAIFQTMQRFKDTRDVGQLGVCLALAIMDEPLCFVLHGDLSARYYGFPQRGPRICGFAISSWDELLRHCAEAIMGMSPRAIKDAAEHALLPPPVDFVATRQDLADVLLTHDLICRNEALAAGNKAETALRRTRDMLCRQWCVYVMSMSPFRPHMVIALETIKSWARGAAVNATYKMALHGIGTRAAEEAICMLSDKSAMSESVLGVCAKHIRTAQSVAQRYLQLCSRDARDGQAMAALAIVTKLLMEGPTLPAGFLDAEMTGFLQQYEQHSKSAAVNWANTRTSYLVPLVDRLLNHRASGWSMFSAPGLQFEERLEWPAWDEPLQARSWTRAFPERKVERLLSHVHGSESRIIRWNDLPCEVLTSVVAGHPDTLDLYRCAACRAHSASLRRCSGCRVYRYCGRECQRKHWSSEHHSTCSRTFATQARTLSD